MKDEYAQATEAQKRILWEIFKLTLFKIKKISRYQLETWVYPAKELKL
tara:strand:- start:6099 stop:6242 length:144 start_codon:yes stop_codon:yes gene_type:complete